MACFLLITCVLCLISIVFGHPVECHTQNDIPSQKARLPEQTPYRYENFANGALYYGSNTAKLGLGVGLLCAAVMATERFARWFYWTFRGSIQYWKDEIKDMRNNGMDSDQEEFEKYTPLNETEIWKSPTLEKRSRHIKWSAGY